MSLKIPRVKMQLNYSQNTLFVVAKHTQRHYAGSGLYVTSPKDAGDCGNSSPYCVYHPQMTSTYYLWKFVSATIKK